MEPPEPAIPAWKYRAVTGAKMAAAATHAAERAAGERAFEEREAVQDRTMARENSAVANRRYCAGHDWVKERQERTGEIEHSR